jgi:hypothetical protein
MQALRGDIGDEHAASASTEPTTVASPLNASMGMFIAVHHFARYVK